MRSLDSILSDEPSVHTLPETSESDSSPEQSVEAETEASEPEEAPKAEARAGTKPPVTGGDDGEDGKPDPDDIAGLKKALAAVRGDKRTERKKWQEAERQLAELRGRLAERERLQSAPQAETPKAPEKDDETDFFGNPIGHLSKRDQRLLEKIQRERFEDRANLSEWYVRQRHEDYDEAKAAFAKAAQQNPHLVQQMMQHPSPADVVYTEGKKALNGGLDPAIQARIEALEAELAAARGGGQQEATTPKAPAKPIPPKSIAGARGTGASVKPSWSGPRSMDDILAG